MNLKFVITLGVLLVVIAFSERLLGFIDMTENKHFTIHKKSHEVLNRLPENTVINFYWSESETSIPVEIFSYGKLIKISL